MVVFLLILIVLILLLGANAVIALGIWAIGLAMAAVALMATATWLDSLPLGGAVGLGLAASIVVWLCMSGRAKSDEDDVGTGGAAAAKYYTANDGSTYPIPDTWSFPRWAAWDECPFQYKCKFILKVPEPPNSATERDDRIHKELASHLNPMATAPLPPEAKDPFHKQLVGGMKEIAYQQMVRGPKTGTGIIIEQQWGFDRGWRPDKWFGDTVWYRQVCDVALIYDDDSVQIIDWKTGRKYGSNDEQMELAALTAMEKFGVQARNGVTVTLVHIDAGGEESAGFHFADRDKLLSKWNARAKKMLVDREWKARASDKCESCPFGLSKGGPCRSEQNRRSVTTDQLGTAAVSVV